MTSGNCFQRVWQLIKKVWNRTYRRRYSYKLRAYFYLYFYFGTPNPKGSLLRSGAKVGDGIFVSGTIGDGSRFGAKRNRSLSCSSKENSYCISRYRIPRPRIDLGLALGEVASAAMDISDGLFQDLNHLCGLLMLVPQSANKIPLSKEVNAS